MTFIFINSNIKTTITLGTINYTCIGRLSPNVVACPFLDRLIATLLWQSENKFQKSSVVTKSFWYYINRCVLRKWTKKKMVNVDHWSQLMMTLDPSFRLPNGMQSKCKANHILDAKVRIVVFYSFFEWVLWWSIRMTTEKPVLSQTQKTQ